MCVQKAKDKYHREDESTWLQSDEMWNVKKKKDNDTGELQERAIRRRKRIIRM